MNRSLKVVLGLVAGGTLAIAAFSARGKKLRSRISGKVGNLRETFSDSIEKKARRIHDSGVSYN